MSFARRMTLCSSLLAGLLVSAACTAEELEPRAELVVVSAWTGLDASALHALGAQHDTTPFLTQLSKRGEAASRSAALGTSSATLASLLTDLPVGEHGLFSLREPGHERLAPGVKTLAERAHELGWFTLGAGGHAKLDVADLGRGFDVWRAPGLETKKWSATEVVASIQGELETALASHERVLLFLEFEDLRGDTWRSATKADEFFEARMAPFRGKGGPVDDAYAAEGEEQSLVQRLKRRLYRQGAGPAREALEASIYGAHLEQLDDALAAVAQTAERARASSEWLVLGGALELRTADLAELWPLEAEASGDVPRQQLRIRNLTSRDLDLRLDAQLGAVEAGEGESVLEGRPVSPQTIPGFGSALLRSALRGDELRLVLQGPSLSLERLWIGGSSAAESDLCELASRTSASWPAGSPEPALEVRAGGGRREELLISTEGEFELLLEYFPPSAELLDVLAQQGVEAREHELRADCAVVRGKGATSFELPARIPSSRLGIALFLDGQRVPSSRMNYRGQVFSALGRVELGLSPGVWLDSRLRVPAPEQTDAWVQLELLDPVAPPTAYRHPTRAERALLQRLDDDE